MTGNSEIIDLFTIYVSFFTLWDKVAGVFICFFLGKRLLNNLVLKSMMKTNDLKSGKRPIWLHKR